MYDMYRIKMKYSNNKAIQVTSKKMPIVIQTLMT